MDSVNEKNKIEQEILVDIENIKAKGVPKHIAIIMDGNGRWAQSKNLPRTFGHKAGIEALRDVIQTASDIGIQYLTLYAFSTENWKRPAKEVSALMQLLVEYLKREVHDLHKNNVKIKIIGDIQKLPQDVQIEIHKALELTKNNSGLCVNIALNYGGRDEIKRAIIKICQKVIDHQIHIDEINESVIEEFMDTAGIPNPDLLIRSSGEYRLSNFLLWQCAYTEFWFSNILWPDFKGKHLLKAIYDFQNRQRRFGGV